jgi:uroporphyrinogen-III synthase
MRVIITRPSREANKWAAALSDTGYDAVALPLVEVASAPEPENVTAAWQGLGEFDAAMFVSGNAVEHFFASNESIAQVFTASSAIKTRAFATGPGTVAALLRAGAEAPWIDAPGQESQQFDSEALWAVMGTMVCPGYRVLIVRGAGAMSEVAATEGHGRDWFARQVLAAGGTVDYVVAYQRVSVRLQDENLALAIRGASDGSVWMFSSSEAIGNLVASCPGQDWNAAKSVVTHPRIGDAARKAGFGTVIESRPSLASLLASIESLQ